MRLSSVLEGRLRLGPETLQINLQNACNLNCDFCWNHSTLTVNPPPEWYRERMSDAHLDAVMSALPKLRPSRALLSGRGEPLLHPRVRELLGALADGDVPVTVQTNGIAGPAPEELVELGVDRLLVNVSAATTEQYERVHPGRGHQLETIKARLKRIAELRGAGTAPQVTLVGIIHEGNRGAVLPLVDLASEVGASRIMLKGMEYRRGLTSLLLRPPARSEVSAALIEAQPRAREAGVELRAGHLEQLVGEQQDDGSFTESLRRGPCYMGWYYLRVTCDGRVMFCCKDKPVDHLERRGLYEIWRSAAYQLLRVGGRDGDVSVGLFDDKCRSCSNFERNRQLAEMLAGANAQPADSTA